MVFYRKYRPQNISELDITKVRERLFSILKSGDIPHAFLFAGPKGLGKTSAARILAKAINCEKKNNESRIKNQGEKNKEKIHNSSFVIHDSEETEPCNKCDACKSITNGSNLDVIEIDAASNRGIEEIRSLREKIKFSPVMLSKKIYIIDEVHMLTIEAFNALLKTLEEPPSHAVFILCTTEPWKLPDTIISRTFFVQFEKPSLEELKRSVQRVIKGEGIDMDEDLYKTIYSYADGSFRDATKIIEELSLAGKAGKITKELFDSTFKVGTINREVINLMKHLSERNAKEALLVIENLSQNGVDFKIVTEKIVGHLRNLLLKKSGVEIDSRDEGEFLKDLEKLDIKEINDLTELFSAAFKDIKFAVLPNLPIEMVVVKWCVIGNEKLKIKNEKLDKKKQDKELEYETKDIKTIDEKKNSYSDDFLARLIEEVKKENHTIAGILRGCKLANVNENAVILEMGYKFHFDKLSDVKVKEFIEKRASEMLGRNVGLNIKLKK